MPWFVPLIAAAASAAAQGAAADSAAKASTISTRADLDSQMEALGLQQQQFDYQNQLLQPFLRQGQAQIPMLQQSANSLNLAEIAGNPIFQQYAQEQLEPVQAAIYQRGLSRSGAGQKAMGAAVGDVYAGIENTLTGRQQSLANVGQTQGINLANLGQANVGAKSGLYGSMGNTAAMNPLQQAAIQGQQTQGAVNMGAALLDYYR